MKPITVIRDQIIQFLDGGNAHLTFDDAVDSYPLGLINERPPEVTYTPWHLVEHLRIAQWDILEFIRDPDHDSPAWPLGYWPDPDSLADDSLLLKTLDLFKKDLAAIKDLVQDPNIDLSAEPPTLRDTHISGNFF